MIRVARGRRIVRPRGPGRGASGTQGAGRLTSPAPRRLCADNRADLVGHLGSKAELVLLLDIAGEDRKGKKTLTRGRLQQREWKERAA